MTNEGQKAARAGGAHGRDVRHRSSAAREVRELRKVVKDCITPAVIVRTSLLLRLCDDWVMLRRMLAHCQGALTKAGHLPAIGIGTDTWYALYESPYMSGVRAFHEKHHAYTASVPSVPPADVQDLRQRLIEEEWAELWAAMRTAAPDADPPLFVLESTDTDGRSTEATDRLERLAAVADALADLLYVVFGTGLAYGLPMDAVFAEVQRSNMTKDVVPKTGRGDKVSKGPSFSPPDLVPILQAAARRFTGAEQEVGQDQDEQDAQAAGPLGLCEPE